MIASAKKIKKNNKVGKINKKVIKISRKVGCKHRWILFNLILLYFFLEDENKKNTPFYANFLKRILKNKLIHQIISFKNAFKITLTMYKNHDKNGMKYNCQFVTTLLCFVVFCDVNILK